MTFILISESLSTFALTLDFEYRTKEELNDPQKRFIKYKNTAYCEKKHFWDFLNIELGHNEQLAAGVNTCLEKVKGSENYNCFEIDIRTKNTERKCHKIKDNLQKANCIATARNQGDKELLELGCKGGLKGQGNIHVLISLTGLRMENYCPLKFSGERLHIDESSGHRFYEGPRKDIHVKFAKCMMQNCYSSQRIWYQKFLEYQAKRGSECKTDGNLDFHCYLHEKGQTKQKICQTTLRLNGITGSHPKMKEVIKPQKRDLAKRFSGYFVNNTRVDIGKTGDGKPVSGWITYTLDNNGDLVKASLSVTHEGDLVNWRPKVDSSLKPIYADYNQLHLEWAGNTFNPNAKSMVECPVQNDVNVKRKKYQAYNAELFYQAKVLGCVSEGKLDSALPSCQQNKIVQAVSDIGVKKNRLLSRTQIWLTGNENPAFAATSNSVLGKYPACSLKYKSAKDIFSKQTEVSSEEKEKIGMNSKSFETQIAIVKEQKYDRHKVKDVLNTKLNNYFSLRKGTIRVPSGNGELYNKMVYEVQAYEKDNQRLPSLSGYQIFELGISKLEGFRKDLKALYCRKLGVDIDLNDKHFLDKFKRASRSAFEVGSTLESDLKNVEKHFENQLKVNSITKPWRRNRKSCK